MISKLALVKAISSFLERSSIRVILCRHTNSNCALSGHCIDDDIYLMK